jgi:hypothetical protein
MSNLQKLTHSFLLLALIVAAPSKAALPTVEIELTPTGEMPHISGLAAVSETRSGAETLAIRVDTSLPDGSKLRVVMVQDGEEADVALLTVELGTAYFRMVDSNEPTGVFPTSNIDAMFVFYKNLRVLEAKFPG